MAYKNKELEKIWFKKRYEASIEYVKNVKLQTGCVDCGYNRHHAALEFDHILPRLRGTVSSQMGKSLKVIKEEIERCEVVCSNCHSIREFERMIGERTDGAHDSYQKRKNTSH